MFLKMRQLIILLTLALSTQCGRVAFAQTQAAAPQSSPAKGVSPEERTSLLGAEVSALQAEIAVAQNEARHWKQAWLEATNAQMKQRADDADRLLRMEIDSVQREHDCSIRDLSMVCIPNAPVASAEKPSPPPAAASQPAAKSPQK